MKVLWIVLVLYFVVLCHTQYIEITTEQYKQYVSSNRKNDVLQPVDAGSIPAPQYIYTDNVSTGIEYNSTGYQPHTGLPLNTAQCTVQQKIQTALQQSPHERNPLILFTDPDNCNINLYSMYYSPTGYRSCPVQCDMTTDTTLRNTAEVVIDHVKSSDSSNQYQCTKQLYGVVSIESSHYPQLNMNSNQIDIEISYRLPSDMHNINKPRHHIYHNYYPIQWTQHTLDTILTQTKRNYATMDGLSNYTFFISNCYALNNRLEILERLMSHINIDSYGKCLHNKDIPAAYQSIPNPSNQKLAVLSQYKFMLSFENSNVTNYFTEKFYECYHANVLCVYLGPYNIKQYLPERVDIDPSLRSIINIHDYSSIEELITYLKFVESNDTEYNSYFTWKKYGFSQSFLQEHNFSWLNTPCLLCDKIHELLYGNNSRTSISSTHDEL